MTEIEEAPDMEMKMSKEETKGNFVSDAHETTGTTSLNDNDPLLEVYLSTDKEATEYISLGVLKGIEGDYQYDIPLGTDLTKYKYVLIWCVDFSVSFGHAVLE
ncbi:DM13 domain-containing protein [Ancylomarina sp. DW003]|nr:DM13 domain-containing protein [Ancylomarina sp. DW003]MDE5422256.1 DM13 domain-containing protein [Ancylomarina sp. DW003]